MRLLRASVLANRMRSAWLLLTCLLISVLVISALVAALVSFYSGVLPSSVRADLSKSGDMSVIVSGSSSSGQVPGLSRAVNAWAGAAFGTVRYQVYRSVWSDYLDLPGPSENGSTPVIQAASMSGVRAFAALTSGAWPGRPQPGQPVPVALPAGTAAALRLHLGSVLRLRDRSTGALVSLQVTGLFRQRSAAPYWAADPVGAAGVTVADGFASYGPAVLSPAATGTAAFGRAGLQVGELSFAILPDLSSLPPTKLAALAGRLASATSSMENSAALSGLNATTSMPQVLADAARSLVAARSLLIISGLQLLVLAAAALALAARLLASHRDEECALLTARGAARWQLVRPSVAEAVLSCTVAAAAGAAIGRELAGVLLSKAIGQHVPASSLLQAGVAAAGVFLFCLVIVVWPALRPAGIAAVRIRRGRSAAVAGALSAGVDVALIVLALLAVRELHTYSAAQAAAGNGVDPVIAAAPAMALAGLAIIPLRLLPLSAKVLERLTARGRRLGAAMANWEISRRPARQSGPVLLVILAVGTGTLALSQYQSWRQSVTDQAAFAAGADVRVDLAQAPSLADAGRISRLPGVQSAMALSEVGYPTGTDEVLAIGSRQAAATVLLRRDLAPVPAATLWREIEPRRQDGILLPGRPARLAITASLAPGAGAAGAGLGPLSAQVTIQDASGATYALSAGGIPADGRLHQLVVQLTPPGGARYPLRLLGVTLTDTWPPYAALALQEPAVLTVAGVTESGALAGPVGQQVAPGSALAGWHPEVSAADLGYVESFGNGSDGAAKPLILSSAQEGRSLQLTLAPGNGPDLAPAALRYYGFENLTSQVTLLAPYPLEPLPAIATSSFLTANHLHVGSVVTVPMNGANVRLRVVASIAHFPTITGTGALIADQTAVQDVIDSQNGAPLPVSQWWLRTRTGAAPPGLPAGASVTVAASTAAALHSDPLSAAPVQAAVPISAAAALLAAFGFCVHVAASARARRSQRALLAALGVPAAAQARLFCAEELMLSLPAAAVGLAVGIGLADLLIPSLSLAANSGLPVPSVLIKIPLGLIIGLAAALSAVPVLAAAVSVLRQPDPAAELRAAEAA